MERENAVLVELHPHLLQLLHPELPYLHVLRQQAAAADAAAAGAEAAAKEHADTVAGNAINTAAAATVAPATAAPADAAVADGAAATAAVSTAAAATAPRPLGVFCAALSARPRSLGPSSSWPWPLVLGPFSHSESTQLSGLWGCPPKHPLQPIEGLNTKPTLNGCLWRKVWEGKEVREGAVFFSKKNSPPSHRRSMPSLRHVSAPVGRLQNHPMWEDLLACEG